MALDVGNTQISVGIFADDGGVGKGELRYHWRVTTHRLYTADEFALQLSQLLALEGLGFEDITGASVACVVPPLQVALREMAERRLGARALFFGPGVRTGMPLLVDNPNEVGADRVADAVAAFELYGGPTIVVDLGTATNFEVVLNALSERAAMLPRVDISPPKGILAKNTVEQLQAGIFFGYGALVEGVCARLKAEVGGRATVVATGGLAPRVLGASDVIDHHEPWLTLYGLRAIYNRNSGDHG